MAKAGRTRFFVIFALNLLGYIWIPLLANAVPKNSYYVPTPGDNTHLLSPEDLELWHQEHLKPSMHHLKVRLGDRRYQIIIIQHSDHAGHPIDSPEGKYIMDIAERGRDFFFEIDKKTIEEKWPGQYSTQDIENIRNQDAPISLRSTRIIIMEDGADPKTAKILTTMKAVMEGDYPEGLPVEKFTFTKGDFDFPRDWHFTIPTVFDPETRELKALRPLLTGGVGQLMGYANIGPRELGALAHFAVLDYALREPEARPLVYLNPDLKNQLHSITGDVNLPYIGNSDHLHLSKFAAYCDIDLAAYYERAWGFHSITPDGSPVKGRKMVMESDINTFNSMRIHNPIFAKVRRSLHENGVTAIYGTEYNDGHVEEEHWPIGEDGIISSFGHWHAPTEMSILEPRLDKTVQNRARFCKSALLP